MQERDSRQWNMRVGVKGRKKGDLGFYEKSKVNLGFGRGAGPLEVSMLFVAFIFLLSYNQ